MRECCENGFFNDLSYRKYQERTQGLWKCQYEDWNSLGKQTYYSYSCKISNNIWDLSFVCILTFQGEKILGGIIGTNIVRYDIFGKDVVIANK